MFLIILIPQVFLKYLYTGKIQVDYANVIPILQLADKYNVKDLLRLPPGLAAFAPHLDII